MKINALIAIIAIIIAASPAPAKIWRVDNNSANNADFRNLQVAYDAASDGDTLYVAGSGDKYSSSIEFKKKLSVIGTGYFPGENPNTQAKPLSAVISGNLYFLSGSAGSIISGFKIEGDISLDDKNIIIKRNLFSTQLPEGYVRRIVIGNSNSASNSIITQNYMTLDNQNDFPAIDFTGIHSSQNVIISNNFIEQIYETTTAINMTASSSAEISYNVIKGKVVIYNTTFRNNILREGTVSGQSNTFQNNIGNVTQFGTSDGNQSNISMSSVFIGTGTTDGKWQLMSGSPAIGTGMNGTDIGMFGGSTPYVLSGMPNIPQIYFFSAPAIGSSSTGLSVRLKARSGR